MSTKKETYSFWPTPRVGTSKVTRKVIQMCSTSPFLQWTLLPMPGANRVQIANRVLPQDLLFVPTHVWCKLYHKCSTSITRITSTQVYKYNKYHNYHKYCTSAAHFRVAFCPTQHPPPPPHVWSLMHLSRFLIPSPCASCKYNCTTHNAHVVTFPSLASCGSCKNISMHCAAVFSSLMQHQLFALHALLAPKELFTWWWPKGYIDR